MVLSQLALIDAIRLKLMMIVIMVVVWELGCTKNIKN